MDDESNVDEAKLAELEAKRKLAFAAGELGEPVTGSFALNLHMGKSVDNALMESADIDVVLTDQSKMDQIYDFGLEDVPCHSPGWEARVTEKSFSIGSRNLELKLVSLEDIITNMTQMWVNGRLTRIQSHHVEKLTRQITFLSEARSWAIGESDQDSINLINRSLRDLLEWIGRIKFEDDFDKDKLGKHLKESLTL